MNFNRLLQFVLFYVCVVGYVQANSNRGLQRAIKTSSRLADDPVKVQNMLDAIQAGNALLVSKLLDDWPINARIGDKKRTAIHYAVLSNSAAVLDILIYRNADLNMIDLDGYTAYDMWQEMHTQSPAKEKEEDRIGALLQEHKAHSAVQASKDKKFYHDLFTERLFEVSAEGNRKLVERFLALGANPKKATLMASPESKHEQESTSHGNEKIKQDNKIVHTMPIHLAIKNGHPAITAILLTAMNNQPERTTSHDRRYTNHYTYDAPLAWGVYYRSWNPLQWAIFAEDWAMVQDLLNGDASLNHLNRQINLGINEESLARYDGSMTKLGGVEYLTSRMDAYDTADFLGTTDKLLTAITTAEREDLITILIHKASTTGRTDIFDKLIEHGIDLRAGEKSEMAMKFALEKPSYAAIDYLIQLRQGIHPAATIARVEKDANLDAYVSKAELGDSRLLSLVLRYGADPDGDKTPLNETLLLRSYKLKHRYNRGKIAKILFDHDADPNIADSDGKTALFHVVSQLQEWSEFPLMLKWLVADVQELLNHKADPNIQTHVSKQTPLHIAIQAVSDHDGGGLGHVLGIIKLLIKHGADTKIKDSQGRDAFDYVEQIKQTVGKTKSEWVREILL